MHQFGWVSEKRGGDRKRGYPERGEGIPSEKGGWTLVETMSICKKPKNTFIHRWLHPKLISTLKFLSNYKTMFWAISQEQQSIKTLQFAKTNSYFYSFTYEKKYIYQFNLPVDRFFMNLMADRKAADSTPKCYLFDGDTNQASIFSHCIRYKWVNMIDW